MQLPYDDIAQVFQFRHLAHGATHGLDIVEQHEQQDDGADDDAKLAKKVDFTNATAHHFFDFLR